MTCILWHSNDFARSGRLKLAIAADSPCTSIAMLIYLKQYDLAQKKLIKFLHKSDALSSFLRYLVNKTPEAIPSKRWK